jgi:membrane peptidoglycan carboxypeptidase
MAPWKSTVLRGALLLLLSALALQLAFLLRIALMTVLDPQSTTFQRSEVWRLIRDKHQVAWAQEWVDAERIAATLKRAVIASEDAGFVEHGGIDWTRTSGPRRAPSASSSAGRTSRSAHAWWAAPRSPSSWRKTCCSPASEPCCARARRWC